MHEIVKIVDGQFVRIRDGEEVERRPAEPSELATPPPEPEQDTPDDTPDLQTLADQLASLTSAVDDLILNALGV